MHVNDKFWLTTHYLQLANGHTSLKFTLNSFDEVHGELELTHAND